MRKLLIVLFAVVPAYEAAAQAEIDLSALIECRADPKDWGGLAFSLMGDPSAIEALGWTAVASENPFLQQYALREAISVFGHETKEIALTSSGPMAILVGVTPEGLAEQLGVTATPASAGQFLGEKIILETTDESDGLKFHTKVALNVSTVASHPDRVLAGCSYLVETIDG